MKIHYAIVSIVAHCLIILLHLNSASLAGLEDLVLEGQELCKGLTTSASLFRHTLGELDAALDRLHLRESWVGAPPTNGVGLKQPCIVIH